jgi:hypothetical protein
VALPSSAEVKEIVELHPCGVMENYRINFTSFAGQSVVYLNVVSKNMTKTPLNITI